MAVFSVCGLPLPENEKPDTPHSLQVRHPGVCSCVKPENGITVVSVQTGVSVQGTTVPSHVPVTVM